MLHLFAGPWKGEQIGRQGGDDDSLYESNQQKHHCRHNAEHTDMLKKLKIVFVQYTVHKIALISIIYFRGKFIVMQSQTCAVWCTALRW